MATVWNAAARRPSVLFQHFQYAEVFNQAVAKCAVELQYVAIRTHARIADQIACVLNGKKILARGHRALIAVGKLSLQFIIEWVTSFFVPTQMVGFQSVRVSDRRLEIET